MLSPLWSRMAGRESGSLSPRDQPSAFRQRQLSRRQPALETRRQRVYPIGLQRDGDARMSSQAPAQDGIRFYDPMATPPREAVAQMHGEQRIGVHCRIMEWTPERMVSYTRYDPGLVLPRHSHGSDSLIYILD